MRSGGLSSFIRDSGGAPDEPSVGSRDRFILARGGVYQTPIWGRSNGRNNQKIKGEKKAKREKKLIS